MGWKIWRGPGVKKALDLAEWDTLFTVAGEIVQSADKQVPNRDDDLRTSARITKSRAKSEKRVNMSYGNRKTPYALRWHESNRMQVKGPGGRPSKWKAVKFRRGRKKKYLRDPFVAIAPKRLGPLMRKNFFKYLGKYRTT